MVPAKVGGLKNGWLGFLFDSCTHVIYVRNSKFPARQTCVEQLCGRRSTALFGGPEPGVWKRKLIPNSMAIPSWTIPSWAPVAVVMPR